MIKKIIKKILPNEFISIYHKSLAILANYLYGEPSNDLVVIGVTGTNGKSTVVNIISHILEKAGYKVGHTSTVSFKIGDKVWLNDRKMTMIGRMGLQKILKNMKREECRYVIVETSSEGIKQFRHIGVNYDVLVFTNLTPEHLEAHGGFENYKNCKLELFKNLNDLDRKSLQISDSLPQAKKIEKVIIANKDDQYFGEFYTNASDKKFSYSINKESDFRAANINHENFKTDFSVNNIDFHSPLIGDFNIYNVLAAICVGYSQGISLESMSEFIKDFKGTPGRMEFINKGQNFNILVDYAPEVESLRNLYSTIDLFPYRKLIHVLGSCGGGRDRDRQPILGQMAGERADIIIVTNEDPYDDDPMEIINNVALGAENVGRVIGEDLFKILDRRVAIKKALEIAEEGDLVLITGKGAEQFMCVKNGMKLPWDDRKVIIEELNNRVIG